MEPYRITFRKLRHSDLPMIHRWLHAPHVTRWWGEDDRPVGYIQTYRVSDDEEYEGLVGIEDSAGIDQST